MKGVLLILGVFTLGLGLTLANANQEEPDSSSSSEESSEEQEVDPRHGEHGHGHHGHERHGHGHHGHGHHDKCHGLEDVDLSDLNLEISELRKFVSKDEGTQGDQVPFTHDPFTIDEVKTAMAENSMGVIRKVVVLASKKRIFAKVLKTGKASGEFTTTVTGSLNTSVDAHTGGKASFGADLDIFTPTATPRNVLSGESTINVNSSTTWIKKLKAHVLQTKATSSSSSKISWSDSSASLENAGSMTANASARSNSETVLLSKKCFATKVETAFDVSAMGSGWSSNIVGKGKGGVFTRVLFATANGTSVSWTFAKVTFKTHMEVKGGNKTLDGTQHITVKSFTETITRPASGGTPGQVDVSNEIKVRVGAQTSLSTGDKVYSTGGLITFRNSRFTVPVNVTMEGEHGGEAGGSYVMVGKVLRKQVMADDLLVNPVFVNSVINSMS